MWLHLFTCMCCELTDFDCAWCSGIFFATGVTVRCHPPLLQVTYDLLVFLRLLLSTDYGQAFYNVPNHLIPVNALYMDFFWFVTKFETLHGPFCWSALTIFPRIHLLFRLLKKCFTSFRTSSLLYCLMWYIPWHFLKYLYLLLEFFFFILLVEVLPPPLCKLSTLSLSLFVVLMFCLSSHIF
jgi:hypothetical protein